MLVRALRTKALPICARLKKTAGVFFIFYDVSTSAKNKSDSELAF